MTIEKVITIEELKALSRLFDDEVWNKHNFSMIDEMLDPDFVDNNPIGLVSGPAAFKDYATKYLTAFPDMRFEIDDLFGQGDKVATRWTLRGTHANSLLGEEATGREITITGIRIYRFVGGKLAESWTSFDQFELLK